MVLLILQFLYCLFYFMVTRLSHSAVNTGYAHASSHLCDPLMQFDDSIEFQSNFNLQVSLV